MTLTKKEVTVASGEYPQISDDELLARRRRFVRTSERWGVSAFICLLLAIAMFVVGVSFADSGERGFRETVSAVALSLAFLSLGGLMFCGLSAQDGGKDIRSIEHEMIRRGITWE